MNVPELLSQYAMIIRLWLIKIEISNDPLIKLEKLIFTSFFVVEPNHAFLNHGC